jgi:hypothetical protein
MALAAGTDLISFIFLPKAAKSIQPIGYRGELLRSLLYANAYVLHNLLKAPLQITNKMGLQK